MWSVTLEAEAAELGADAHRVSLKTAALHRNDEKATIGLHCDVMVCLSRHLLAASITLRRQVFPCIMTCCDITYMGTGRSELPQTAPCSWESIKSYVVKYLLSKY